MVDEIDFFVLCSHARSFLVKNFAIPVLVDRNTITEPCKYPFSGPLTMAKKCYYCKTVGTWF
jgi:hypothetical protein